ncbi:MAG: DUF1211 domain-containing protein [Euryarchaeota archaeon]|nr:DUF1211 domain-containing protein [Euryarchaeota archaeon]
MTNESANQNVWMTTARIETLVDGIFAIAMTLLVLSLDVPQIVSPASNAAIWQALVGMSHKFWMYALSFILLAIFWRVNHQQFYLIKKADTTLLWINFLWLMFVALVPFSTNLVGDYGNYQVPMIFFHINMFIIGVLYGLNWRYADRKNFLDESLDRETIDASKRVNLVLPIAALIAIALTFISPSWSSLAYFLIFFMKKTI